MDGYKQIPLSAFIASMRDPSKGIRNESDLIPDFSCPLNPDIEYFLKHKAIEFDRQSISKTFLVFASYQDKPVLVGYYTLANKTIVIRRRRISRTLWDRIKKFGSVIQETNTCSISAPLIAQLGKNYFNSYNELITGDELLQMAINQVKVLQGIVGGKVVYLECEDDEHLIGFYERNQFRKFDERPLDKDETNLKGDYLIQMLCYLS